MVPISDHTTLLEELSQDDSIPKFATHLIYLTKSPIINKVEEKIIKSIFSQKPKRADVYWFLNLQRTNEPYTLSYSVAEILDDKIIKVNINVGFRVLPKTELYFKKIVKDLVKEKQLNLIFVPMAPQNIITNLILNS